ncbi:hypothetical protein IAR50_006460 [Cryptococcus sp. DSM 104548]
MIPRAHIARHTPKLRPLRLSLITSRLIITRPEHSRTLYTDKVDDAILDSLDPGATITQSGRIKSTSHETKSVSGETNPTTTPKQAPSSDVKSEQTSAPAPHAPVTPFKCPESAASTTGPAQNDKVRTRISRLGVATAGRGLSNRPLDNSSFSPEAKPIEETVRDVSHSVGHRRPAYVHRSAHERIIWRAARMRTWPVNRRDCGLALSDIFDTYDTLACLNFPDRQIRAEEVMGADFCYTISVCAKTHSSNHHNPPIFFAVTIRFLPGGGIQRIGRLQPDDPSKGKSGPQMQKFREHCVTEYPALLPMSNPILQAQQLVCREALVKIISEVCPACKSRTGEFEQVKSRGWKMRDLNRQKKLIQDKQKMVEQPMGIRAGWTYIVRSY